MYNLKIFLILIRSNKTKLENNQYTHMKICRKSKSYLKNMVRIFTYLFIINKLSLFILINRFYFYNFF